MLDPNVFVGETLEGTYRLQRFIGSGGFGWVYEAEELLRGQTVGRCALKLVRCSSSQEEQAFQTEVRALANLDHPGIIRFRGSVAVESGPLKGCLGVCMELADECLDGRMGPGKPLPNDEAVAIGSSLVDGLAYLHTRQMIHRDIKPANIFRVGSQWKLGDLGLLQTLSQTVAKTSMRRGTLVYASPEVLKGQVGSFTDVWAFGVLFHEMFAGRPPFEDGTDAEIITQIVTGDPDISPGLPASCEEIVRGCLERDRNIRWDVSAIASALAACNVGQPSIASPHPQATPSASNSVPAAPAQPTRPLLTVTCPKCGGASKASAARCASCGQTILGTMEPAILAVKYRLGCEMQQKDYIAEALAHFEKVLAVAPGYADAGKRVSELKARLGVGSKQTPFGLQSLMRSELSEAVATVRDVSSSLLGSLDFSGNGRLLCGARWESRQRREIRLEFKGLRIAGKYSADSHLIHLYDLTKSAPDFVELKVKDWVDLAISPSAQMFATSGKSTVSLWEVEEAREIGRFEVDGSLGLSFCVDGMEIVAASAEGVRGVDLATGKDRCVVHSNDCLGFAIDRSSGQCVVIENDNLSVWEMTASRKTASLKHEAPIIVATDRAGGVPTSLLSNLVSVLSKDGVVRVVDIPKGERRQALRWTDSDVEDVRTVEVRQISLHPSGEFIAVGLAQAVGVLPALHVRDLRTGKIVWENAAPSQVAAVRFSSDGRFLAALYESTRQKFILEVWTVDLN